MELPLCQRCASSQSQENPPKFGVLEASEKFPLIHMRIRQPKSLVFLSVWSRCAHPFRAMFLLRLPSLCSWLRLILQILQLKQKHWAPVTAGEVTICGFMNPDSVCANHSNQFYWQCRITTQAWEMISLKKQNKTEQNRKQYEQLNKKTPPHPTPRMLTELRRCFFQGEKAHASAQGWESVVQIWQLWHGETLSPGLLVPSLVSVFLCF